MRQAALYVTDIPESVHNKHEGVCVWGRGGGGGGGITTPCITPPPSTPYFFVCFVFNRKYLTESENKHAKVAQKCSCITTNGGGGGGEGRGGLIIPCIIPHNHTPSTSPRFFVFVFLSQISHTQNKHAKMAPKCSCITTNGRIGFVSLHIYTIQPTFTRYNRHQYDTTDIYTIQPTCIQYSRHLYDTTDMYTIQPTFIRYNRHQYDTTDIKARATQYDKHFFRVITLPCSSNTPTVTALPCFVRARERGDLAPQCTDLNTNAHNSNIPTVKTLPL